MEKSLVFGGKCTESLASYDQESQLWKTFQLSLFGGLIPYSDHFPRSGMMRNGVLYQLHNLVHPTCGKDGFVLPTPTASDSDKHGSGGLHRRIVQGRKYSAGDHRVKNLPTPNTACAKATLSSSAAWKRMDIHRNGSMLNVEVAKLAGLSKNQAIGSDFRLNPHFVTEMMGFPIDWLDLEH